MKKTTNTMTITSYEKTFNTLEDMVNDFITLHPELELIFRGSIDDNGSTCPEFLIEDIMSYFADNQPSVSNGTKLPVSISISANKIYLKTDKYFSIQWKFNYNRNGEYSNIIANITTFTKESNHPNLHNMISLLSNEDNGWKIIEK